MYDKILLPIDRGHKSNKTAAKEAMKIADAFDSSIDVLYVKTKADACLNENEDIEPIREIKNFFESSEQDINYIVREGKPSTEIYEYENEISFDLIIMSTHSRSWLQKITLESITNETIQNVSCPVLTMTNN